MSEENKENTSTPAAKPAAPAAKEEAPVVVEPGEFAQALQKAGLNVTPVTPDAWGTETLDVTPEQLLKVGEFLRDQAHFDLALSCTGVDWKDHRQSVYHLYSTQSHKTLVLKVNAVDDHSPSLFSVWPAVDWHERESYDLVGIIYDGHPSLKRILMPVDWLGHPLRKDYKVDDPRLVWNER